MLSSQSYLKSAGKRLTSRRQAISRMERDVPPSMEHASYLASCCLEFKQQVQKQTGPPRSLSARELLFDARRVTTIDFSEGRANPEQLAECQYEWFNDKRAG